MSDISREELTAFSDAHSKLAVALSKITDVMESITKKQDNLLDKMTNGVSDKIVNGVTSNYDNTHKETIESLNRLTADVKELKILAAEKLPEIIDENIINSDIAKDIQHTKWFVAVIGIVTIVCIVILRVIGQSSVNQTMEKQTEVIQHMLQSHIESQKLKGI